MKIGYDISQTGNNKAGCGYFADSLIQALTEMDRQNEYILYPHFGTSFWDPKGRHTTLKIDQPNVSMKLIGRNFAGSIAFWKSLPPNGEERLGNPDIIHANNYSCPTGIKRARIVYTLHDLNFLEHPEYTTEQNRCVCFGGVFAAAIHADFIISVSAYSKKKFLEIFPHYPAERIRVVFEGSRFAQAEAAIKTKRPVKGLVPSEFWLAVGTLEPRKNLRRLLKAFALFSRQAKIKFPLVLAGGRGWLEDDLEEFMQELGITDNVRMLGYASDEELSWLYRNCFSFVYPSLYEGFGLPVLEAMGQGAAVITSNSTSLPEVAGSAALFVNPLDELDIVGAFQKVGGDVNYREELKRRAVIQAKKFSWEKSAAEVLKIYNQVIAIPKFGGNPA
jgi:glycosyltransferase involved in cell wall biosynthesis